jgi:hypothetical protein
MPEPAQGPPLALQSLALPEPFPALPDAAADATPVLVGWGTLLVLVGIAFFILRNRRQPAAPGAPGWAAPNRVEWGLAVAVCAALAACATWPMAVSSDLVQHNFDALGSTWLLWHLARGGPLVEAVDTWLYLGLGVPLSHLWGPVRAYHLCTLAGVSTAALAAWWAARVPFRQPRVVAWAAPVAVALNPLVGTAVVEGHGGLLVGPGLALLLGTVQADPRPRPWRWASWVALAGLLCALQSGYFALMGGLCALLWGLWQRRPLHRVALLALAPALLFIGVFVGQIHGVGGAAQSATFAAGMLDLPLSDIATLDTLAGLPLGSAGVLMHTRHALIFALLVPGVFLPLVAGDRTGRGLALLALLAILLSMGTELRAVCHPETAALMPLPLRWLVQHVPLAGIFRFPVRFLWIYYTVAGLATARTLANLSMPWLRRSLLAALVLECLVLGVRPWESSRVVATVPSAYGALQPGDRVMDLWPGFGPEHLQGVMFKELSCYYQTGHGLDLPFECMSVHLEDNALIPLTRQLTRALAADSPQQLRLFPADALAWHPDAFPEATRAIIQQRLEGWWGPPLATSTDGGERVVLFRIVAP